MIFQKCYQNVYLQSNDSLEETDGHVMLPMTSVGPAGGLPPGFVNV